MKLKTIFIGSLLAFSLVACSSSPGNINKSFEQDIIQIDDLEIKLVKHEVIEDENALEDNQKLNKLFNNLETDQSIYMVEAEISSPNYDHSLDFSATDSNGKEIRPVYGSLSAGKSEICKVYFVIDKDTEISKFNTNIEKDGKVSSHSFRISDDNRETEEVENNEDERGDRIVLNVLNPDPDVYISIHGHSTWPNDMLSDEEKSNLSSYLTNPENDVLILEYTIRDERENPRPIDRVKVDKDTDLIDPFILNKDKTKIEAVISHSEQTESSKEIYNKDYFIVQNTDNIEDIYFDIDLDNKKIEAMGIGYGYDK